MSVFRKFVKTPKPDGIFVTHVSKLVQYTSALDKKMTNFINKLLDYTFDDVYESDRDFDTRERNMYYKHVYTCARNTMYSQIIRQHNKVDPDRLQCLAMTCYILALKTMLGYDKLREALPDGRTLEQYVFPHADDETDSARLNDPRFQPYELTAGIKTCNPPDIIAMERALLKAGKYMVCNKEYHRLVDSESFGTAKKKRSPKRASPKRKKSARRS